MGFGSGRARRCAARRCSQFGADLELLCRRAFLGKGIWGGRAVRFGGGGHRDPWAVLTVGDLAFVGDEAFVNVCRPVLIGREVFLTMRSLIVTHNIGHSILEGFEVTGFGPAFWGALIMWAVAWLTNALLKEART